VRPPRRARILIVEPNEDVRAPLELLVKGLGLEPVSFSGVSDQLDVADAAIVEPGLGEGLTVAKALRARGVPLVFASIFPADAETRAMQPAAYLVKPFPRHAMENALSNALSLQ